jgi:very-short-patch-repair endonuclease
MSITNRQAITLYQLLIKRLSEIVREEIDRDLASFETLDTWGEFALRAYWTKRTDLIIEGISNRSFTRPASGSLEELQLIQEIFGDWVGVTSSDLRPDITARLNSLKRRAGDAFEREVKNTLDLHEITSPVEQIFLMEWRFARIDERCGVTLKPQKAVQTNTGEYRVDFLVVPEDTSNQELRIAIELDGHMFHEKSKSQVAADKKRERAIVATGVTVLRFSGTEVVFKTRQCVEEVASYIRDRLAR